MRFGGRGSEGVENAVVEMVGVLYNWYYSMQFVEMKCMLEIKFYDTIDDILLEFAVII